MLVGTPAETAHFGIVFLSADISSSLFKRLDRFEKTAPMLLHINVGVIIDVFSIIDRGLPNFSDCRIDLRDGDVFVCVNLGIARLMLQEPTGCT